MTIKFNVLGNKRKELVKTIATWVGKDIKYCGAPSFAYEVDCFTIDRDGCVSFDDGIDGHIIERLLEHLYDEGYEFETDGTPKQEESEDLSLTVTMPRNFFTEKQLENLKKLVAAKSPLLKEALAVSNLPIIISDDTVSFPWFEGDIDAEHFGAYTNLITSICRMAKEAKRVNAKEKESTNAKYEFRCFLLRLGFIGDEYKPSRKILLEKLSGSAAFKSGKAKEVAVCSE